MTNYRETDPEFMGRFQSFAFLCRPLKVLSAAHFFLAPERNALRSLFCPKLQRSCPPSCQHRKNVIR